MKKFIVTAALLIVAGATVGLLSNIHPASASQGTPGYSQTSVLARQGETLGTAAGAAITSPVYDLANVDSCEVVADNSAGGSSRTLNVDWMGSDGTTILYRQAITVTNGTRALVVIDARTPAASAPTGVTVIPAPTGRRMQFTLASAGAAAGSLAIYCR